ncbi:MAG: hypothetical protein LBF88_06170 [Planctomycetaceae bacterium]|jgi:hypothetical protein|nr:hypothetical protein [Planctomycetaceae bacterium]
MVASAVADFDPVDGWQWVLPAVWLSDFLLFTGASRLSPTQYFRRNIAYLLIFGIPQKI